MAGRKRNTQHTNSTPRWIERVAIAALAALATQGSNSSTAIAAITIFLIVVVVEELGRRWVWQGRTVTLRDVALSTVGELRVQLRKRCRGPRRSRRRNRARKMGRRAAAAQGDSTRRAIQE